MNVPNRYKGFSQLPENVQQNMDPSLANKYQMGGSVMQRPLFRQMGGPTDMMPQDMMPPPPMGGAPMAPPPMGVDPAMEAQLMEAENTGQQIGAQFSEDMMMNLEGAEDYQSLIDGIRGNQLPIDARYQELAGYVGEQDAMATPESVLALTQPTIMMTEQGAMDSGIGELMQGIAGDVPMEGPMDEGVGALMAAGAGNTPPVNFRNGGPVMVRGYAGQEPNSSDVRPGGGAPVGAGDIGPYFKSAMAAREGILGSAEDRSASLQEDREMAKAQMLFDIAGTALNFAGQTQGNTLAERLANAASQTQLTDKIGARSAGMLQSKKDQRTQDQQLALSALASAEQRFEADRARAGQVTLANVTAANDMTKLLSSQTYATGEKALDRTARLTLADNQIAANAALQESGAGNTMAEIAARGALQKELQESQAGFTASLQNDRFTFERGKDLNNRAHQTFLQQRQAENVRKLEALRFDNSEISRKLQNRFVQENYKIQSELQLGNRLVEMGASNAYDIGKMAKGQEYSIALQNNLSSLQDIRQEDDQAHDLAKQALQIAASSQNIITTFAAQKALQEASQDFNGTESEKTRAFNKAKMMIDNAFKTEQLQISQGQLTLGQASLAVDKSYKAGRLAVEQAEAEAVKLGSDSLTKQINFITDPDRLTAYSKGELDNTDQFETAVLKYVADRAVFNSALGRDEPIGADLPPAVLKKIKQGNAEFYKKLVPNEPPKESVYFDSQAQTDPETPVVYLRDARKELLNPDGSVALDSPVWENSSTDFFNKTIDYTQAIGASKLKPLVSKVLSEGFAELANQYPEIPSAEIANLTEAAKTLDNFATKLLQFKTNAGDDRVLKFVQEHIEKTVENIRPGGFLLKTDVDAVSTLKALKQEFSFDMKLLAAKLPEYGGRSEGSTQAQTEKYKNAMDSVKFILNEVIAFERGFLAPPRAGSGASSNPVTDTSVQATTDFLNNLGGNNGTATTE